MFMLLCAPFGSLAECSIALVLNLLWFVQRVCGRAVECTGLENRRGEIHREFESHRTRQKNHTKSIDYYGSAKRFGSFGAQSVATHYP